jgi:hypothetical protein
MFSATVPHLFLVAGPYQSACGANLADQLTSSNRKRSPGAREKRTPAVGWDGLRNRQVRGYGGGPDSVFDVTVAGIGRDLTSRAARLRQR